MIMAGPGSPIARRRFAQRMTLVLAGPMRMIAHFTHIAAKQRPHQRRLTDVGVRDQAEGDVGHWVGWAFQASGCQAMCVRRAEEHHRLGIPINGLVGF